MNVPFAVGRVNATWPLATLTITHDTLRLAPRWFARMITTDFEVSLGHIRSAFPTRSRVFASGIGFELADGEVAYFWTWTQREEILAELQRRRVPVTMEPRSVLRTSLLGQFSWRAPSSSVATVPALPQPVLRLMPVFMVLGAVVIAVIASMGGTFGWLVIPIGVVGIAQCFLVWRRSRRPHPPKDGPPPGAVL